MPDMGWDWLRNTFDIYLTVLAFAETSSTISESCDLVYPGGNEILPNIREWGGSEANVGGLVRARHYFAPLEGDVRAAGRRALQRRDVTFAQQTT